MELIFQKKLPGREILRLEIPIIILQINMENNLFVRPLISGLIKNIM
jgi:hypothetical protein